LKRLKIAECDQYLTFFFDLKDFTEKISLILKRERERERERERGGDGRNDWNVNSNSTYSGVT